MPVVSRPDGPIECLVTGSGEPVTLFAHGFAGSIAETRPFGSGLLGRRVFFHFRGHGATAGGAGPWSYDALEEELSCVRAAFDARRGLGVSLGAGALLRSAVQRDLFGRIVVVLPPAVDEPRDGRALHRVEAIAQRAGSGDVEGVTELLLDEQADEVRRRRVVRLWARRQAERLAGDGIRNAITQIPLLSPLEDRSLLAAVTCPVLLIGQEGDEAHPSRVIRELAEALPDARAEIFGPGGVLWTHRGAIRHLIGTFLNT